MTGTQAFIIIAVIVAACAIAKGIIDPLDTRVCVTAANGNYVCGDPS